MLRGTRFEEDSPELKVEMAREKNVKNLLRGRLIKVIDKIGIPFRRSRNDRKELLYNRQLLKS
jgi:hypothetical protein